MKIVDPKDIPKRELHDDERIAEITAFLASSAEACEVERFAKDIATDYNRYKALLWRLKLHKEMKVFTRRGRVFIKYEEGGAK